MKPIEPSAFWEFIKSRGINFVSGVPDSTFKATYDSLISDDDIKFVPAVREDVALGLASAPYFHNQLGAIIIQNSGIGNLVNPLTSFNLIYRIPVLMIIGWRGYGGPQNDAPEHWIMGTKTPEILKTLDIPFKLLEPDNFKDDIDLLLKILTEKSLPGALLIRPGVVI